MNDNQSQTIDQVAKIDFIQELLKLGNRDHNIEQGSIPNTARTNGDL
jgi:hypothetical protein